MTSMVPVKVRKQEETVWIKLISYFRAHVGAHRKGTGCVVIKRQANAHGKRQANAHAHLSQRSSAARRLRGKNRRWSDL